MSANVEGEGAVAARARGRGSGWEGIVRRDDTTRARGEGAEWMIASARGRRRRMDGWTTDVAGAYPVLLERGELTRPRRREGDADLLVSAGVCD